MCAVPLLFIKEAFQSENMALCIATWCISQESNTIEIPVMHYLAVSVCLCVCVPDTQQQTSVTRNKRSFLYDPLPCL